SELDASGLMARLANDLRGIAVEFKKVDDPAHLDSTLMRLEEVGTDYRTIAGLLENEIEGGDEAAIAAVAAGRAEVEAAYRQLVANGEAAIAAYPQKARDVRETLDKFDFWLLADD
ncbi:MAG: hypothetical protein AAF311_10635, partial [Pseudomonadota bacterium]